MAVVIGWTFSQPVAAADSSTDTSSDTALLEQMAKLTSDDAAARKQALFDLAKSGDSRLEAFLENYRTGSVYLWNGQIVVCAETEEDDDFNELAPLTHPLTGEPVLGADGKQAKPDILDLEDMSPDRAGRLAARSALFLLKLSSPNAESRLVAVKKSGTQPFNAEALPFLTDMAENDTDEKIKFTARESLLLIRLGTDVPLGQAEQRWAAAGQLAEMNSLRALPVLEEMLRDKAFEKHGQAAREQCEKAVATINSHQSFVNWVGYVFQGISLGSILIIMALGLAITFGLMGVINMAHGELMMVGAFTTYVIQQLFVNYLPEGMFNWYYVAALPSAFLAAAFVGWLLELAVIRHLYRRPLESLLATWGVSILLIQTARLIFGDNIGVNSPTWLRGNVEVLQDVILPFNRLFIIALCALCVAMIYTLINRTKLGLRMRATMQNRDMADSLGVNTRRIDSYTFAFGSGLAGLAGYALTLIGGVTPDMGQNYIVESFLVVVTGGVGELLGVICSGLGLGVATKVIEPMQFGDFTVEAIWAKVFVLACVVAFIQFKPAGLFPPKGRLADV
ncbi:MAG: urea transport system permease protein [Limisphaerales bacterium]|jgi:urea transport system permease protein